MKIAYKFRMYPNKQKEAKLDFTLEVCRQLYNTALADRINCYRLEGINRSCMDQAITLTLEKKEGKWQKVYAQVLQDVLQRVDKAHKGFFRRLEAGDKPGFPMFKRQGKYTSFTYTQRGFDLEGPTIFLSMIGTIRIFQHREVEGKVKTCTIKKDDLGHWYAILVSELPDPAPITPKTVIEIDIGETIQYPEHCIKAEKRLYVAKRNLARKKRGSSNRQKAKAKVVKLEQKLRSHRNEFLHQMSREIVDLADLIVFKISNAQGVHENQCLAGHIRDYSWDDLILLTQYKAAKAGKEVKLVDVACSN